MYTVQQSHGPQHAQLVLRKPQLRFTDRPNQPGVKVTAPAHVIQDAVLQPVAGLIGNRIQQQPVDREVAPQHILARVHRELHGIRSPPIRISTVMPKRRHLGRHPHLRQVIDHQHHSKVRPY